ncbi:MAG: hypothetical protein SCARUB_03097 [Candidatus Scalindua rubra]|uniref:Protein TusB n=1 Tax=Candidatus Scalindua rubra TaxID=1872076 RepID=A0A1E3X814_9BACT|nr:MAG: hypothetical protein SCARUB_03097 [Candidatus Scalindua rubra]
MKILFIVKDKSDLDCLLKIYEKSQAKKLSEIIFLLIHDAVLVEPKSYNNFKVFASRDDVEARGVDSQFDTLDYSQILKLMSDCSKVICW